MRVVMMGPQGCGKGTQGKLLAEALGVPIFGMGDIFRRAAAEPGELGREIAAYVRGGDLVPDKYVIEAIVRALHSNEASQGFVLDGYPRRENQVDELEQILGERSLDKVVLLEVPLEEAMRRVRARLICSNSKCGEIFSRDNGVSKGDPCPRCTAPLATREDDNESALMKRYETYERETMAAINLYAERGLLVPIDGTRDRESVHKTILSALYE
jgi:adenylate kinase